jgi:hypothetical protein
MPGLELQAREWATEARAAMTEQDTKETDNG